MTYYTMSDRASVEFDETTGLPKLPKGYFWRVGRQDGYGDHKLFLLRTSLPFSIFPVAYEWIFDGLTEEKIKYKAQEIYLEWTKDRKSSTLVGNYPPKTLK